MALKVGRVTLRTPNEAPYRPRANIMDDGMLATGVPNPSKVGEGADAFHLEGCEKGSGALTTVEAMRLKERRRFGSVWVQDDSSPVAVPTGYYAIDFHYDRPRGAPYRVPWSLELVATPAPMVCRQAEDDNVTGTDTADTTADEGYNVTYTPTTSEVKVLDPRNVAGAEKLNLPAGTYRVIARVWQTMNTSAKWRLKTTKLDGTVITTGSQVAIGAAGAWTDIDLGSFTISAADDGANFYEVHIQGVAAELGDTKTDRIYLLPA